MLIWLKLTIKQSLIFDFFQYFFHGSKNASGVLWGTYWKNSEQNYQYASFLWKRKKRNLFFMLIWMNSTIKQSLIFDFFFQYLFHWYKNASGVLEAPVETFLSRTTNLCRFCRNEEKETYFSRLFDCIWPWNGPWFLYFFSDISFIGPKMFLEYWGHLLKTFWAKLPIRIVFVETKKKKPNFHDYLIVFDHKMILDFWSFPISLL